jgi:DNA-binding protein HU-beta
MAILENRMNKNELIAAVAASTGLSQGDAAKATDSVFAAITQALQNGAEVRILGFGSFSVVTRAAREGRNPQTGAVIQIAASKNPKFKAGKALKTALN